MEIYFYQENKGFDLKANFTFQFSIKEHIQEIKKLNKQQFSYGQVEMYIYIYKKNNNVDVNTTMNINV